MRSHVATKDCAATEAVSALQEPILEPKPSARESKGEHSEEDHLRSWDLAELSLSDSLFRGAEGCPFAFSALLQVEHV